MDLQELHAALNPATRDSLRNIYLLDEIDSTNMEAIRLLKEGQGAPLLVVADSQTAGRGRRGRSWLSPSGGLYLSLASTIDAPAESLPALSLVAAIAVLSACNRVGARDLQLKWPNDVLAVNKKLAGVLLETQMAGAERCVIFGVGINLHLSEETRAHIDRPVTDLEAVCGEYPGQASMAAIVSEELLKGIARFEESGFATFQQTWNDNDRYRQRDIVISSDDKRTIGKALGVNEAGLLLLQTATGVQTLNTGEIFPSLAAASGEEP